MKIIEKNIDELVPYENNARINDGAVDAVANSISDFGWKQPIVIDKNNVIVAGHTRLKAAKKLGLQKVPCIVADDLDDEQIKAFRIADNSSAQLADWDMDKLMAEIQDIDFDMAKYGLDEQLDNNNAISYIDDLLENEFSESRIDAKTFGVTFQFSKDCEGLVNDYIKEKGKQPLIDLMLEEIKKNA